MTKGNITAITLSRPLQTAAGPVSELQIREPDAGELRGVKLAELLQGEAGAVLTVLPRIALPGITPAEADRLSAQDVVAVYTELALFFTGGDPRAMTD